MNCSLKNMCGCCENPGFLQRPMLPLNKKKSEAGSPQHILKFDEVQVAHTVLKKTQTVPSGQPSRVTLLVSRLTLTFQNQCCDIKNIRGANTKLGHSWRFGDGECGV